MEGWGMHQFSLASAASLTVRISVRARTLPAAGARRLTLNFAPGNTIRATVWHYKH